MMQHSQLKITLRRLYRNKTFSFLNIAGLSVGIAISVLIFLIITSELSIDQFHKNRNRIFRVVSTETYRNGLVDYDGDAPMPLADALRGEFPQPEKISAMWRIGQADFTLSGGAGQKFRTGDVYYAEPELFDIFNFPWISGDPRTALKDPYTAALARSLARTWFGSWQNALGKTIYYGEDPRPYKINGILEDAPENTDIPMKLVLSYASFRIAHQQEMAIPRNWDNFNESSQCFFLLRNSMSIAAMNAMLPGFVARHFTPLFANSDTRDSCYFQPFKQMHFDKTFGRYGKEGWSASQLWALGLIGIFILTMACINFINLSTAQALNRGKEVGVRKVLGSKPGQLFLSFMQETGLLVFCAMLLGLGLAYTVLPPLSQVLEKPIFTQALFSWTTIVFLLATATSVTMLAGFYPGLVMSRFEPIAAIKSKLTTGKHGGLTLRRSLIVLQFVIAQMLIIATLIVMNQMDYFRTRPMGFNRKAIVLIYLPYSQESESKNAYFKNRVTKIPGVLSASLCNQPPSTGDPGSSLFTFEDHEHPEDFELASRFADSDYLGTFQIGLAAGRYPYPSDTVKEVLLNESVVKRLGFSSPSAVVGKYIHWGSLSSPRLPIVGVVRDFHSGSLKEKIAPLMLMTAARNYGTLAVKLNPASIAGTMTKLQNLFAAEYPNQFFDNNFFDESVVNYYNAEAIASKLFKIFSGLAIFISCLGLYGLVSFMAVQRTKEVGIRKVLGASIQNIVYIFSKEFTLLIGLAFLVAAPLGYIFMHQWLASFYYHTGIGWGVFVTAIALSLVIAWITVGYKALKAAIANPVKSLRTE